MEPGRVAAAIGGARTGRATPWRRLFARAAARELRAVVVPDEGLARGLGLDLAAAGLALAPTPRHASILVAVGDLPDGLARAAAVAWAQMPRPRALLSVGGTGIAVLPPPDVAVAADQAALADGVRRLRAAIHAGAWAEAPPAFEPPGAEEAEQQAMPAGGHDHAMHGMGHDHAMAGMGHDHAMHGQHAPTQADAHAAHAPAGEPVGAHTEHQHGGSEHAGHDAAGGHAGHAAAGAEHTGHDHAAMMRRAGEAAEPPAAPAHAPAHPAEGRSDRGAHAGHDHAAMRHTATGDAAMEQAPAGAEDADHAAMDHGEMSHGDHGAMHEPHAASGHGHASHRPTVPAPDHAAMGHGSMEHGAGGDVAGVDAASAGRPPADGDEHAGHGEMDHAAMGHGEMDHAAMGHGGMDHSAHMMGGFMSMVAMTKDLPRSADGLPMEWTTAPFGPLFPGLPGGLTLSLTLDGDGVAAAAAVPGAVARGAEAGWLGPAASFPDRLARLDPLAPASYRILALHALATCTGNVVDGRAWIGALERERAASHLGWLALLARQLGSERLAADAGRLHLALARTAAAADVAPLQASTVRLIRSVERMPLLGRRLTGIGALPDGADARGPVARAAGAASDARVGVPAYDAAGFAPRVGRGGDARARLAVRLAEIEQSLGLVLAAGSLDIPAPDLPADLTGMGMAAIETPRGAAHLHLEVSGGQVTAAHLDTPSARHAELVPTVAVGLELADALVAVGSLDLSPWELDR